MSTIDLKYLKIYFKTYIYNILYYIILYEVLNTQTELNLTCMISWNCNFLNPNANTPLLQLFVKDFKKFSRICDLIKVLIESVSRLFDVFALAPQLFLWFNRKQKLRAN